MVDFDLEIKKVHPINIKEIELNHYKIDDNAKKSIILYNAAIGYIRKGNTDLAVSDLKQALSYNRDFTEAIKLIGLCYAIMRESKKAEKTFKKLNKYAVYNVLANEYIQSLSIKGPITYNDITITEDFESIHSDSRKQYGKVNNKKGIIVASLIIVMVIIAGVSLNCFYPEAGKDILMAFKTSTQGVEAKIKAKDNIDETSEEIDKNSEDDEVLTEQNTTYNRENEDAQEKLENTKSDTDNSKNNNITKLNDAERFLNNGSYEQAASILISMKSMDLDNEIKIKFTELWQELKLNPLWTIYNDGNKLYKENKYTEALPKLIIASEIDPDLDIMPWITFQIGMCYKETNDNANALIYFNKVKDKYPKSEYSSNARMMISEISG